MTRFHSGPGWITLEDGPCAPWQKFFVKRAPIFVRAVEAVGHVWNILDQLDDEPTAHEEIFVYKQVKWIHVRANNRRESGVYYTYTYIPISNDEKLALRSNKRWREWVSSQPVD